MRAEMEASAEAETAWVDTVVARSSASAQTGEVVHARLLQPGRPGEREDPPGQLLLRQPDRIRRHSRRVEGTRRTGGIRDSMPAVHRRSSGDQTRRYLAGRMLALSRRRSPRVVIIGAGFGGLAAAVALRRKGIDDLSIIERADGVGGTWRQNVYPGAACDIQSHLYSFSFAPNRAWTRTYAYQPEILAYLESVADDFDLRRHLMLDTSVRRLTWNEQGVALGGRTRRRRTVVADVVVSAVGLFGAVRYPDIEGLADFSGDAHAHRAMGCDRRPDAASGWRSSAPAPAACRSYPNSPTPQRN